LEGLGQSRAEYEVFTVEKSMITFPETLYQLDSTGNVGVILDSGTSNMRLVEPSYNIFRDSFRATTSYLKSVAGDSLFNTCSKEALLTSPPSIFYSRTRYSSKPNLIYSVNFYDLERSDCVL
jgi:hypothetical protein